jgi:vacuolar-type H+-ATPase subunit C/Vma6
MKRKPVIALLALMIMGTAAVSGAYAYAGSFGKGFLQDEEVKAALENGDYDSFMAAVTQELPNQLTEERFERMAERFQARQAVMQALEAGDYDAWVAAVEAAKPPGITEIITEENFDTYRNFHEAIQNQDFELAKELASALGLEHRGPGMYGKFSHHKGCMA